MINLLTDEEKQEILEQYYDSDGECEPHLVDRVERALLEKMGKQDPVGVTDAEGNLKTYKHKLPPNTHIYAHTLPQKAIPEGWHLVPIEPTASMVDAGVAMALQVSVHGEGGWSKYLIGLYKQMLSASPKV